MKNDAIEIMPASTLQCIPAAELAGHIEAIRQIQAQVMREGIHYGKIPGCGDKPALFKSGAEIVMMTFQVHLTDIRIEDLSTADEIRYRVITVGSTPDGTVQGMGVGEASSNEEKYMWRKAVNDPEWAATPVTRRREKHGKDYDTGNDYTIKQVRTNPADQGNTILKMAKKRSYVDLSLTSTAASEVFTQKGAPPPPPGSASAGGAPASPAGPVDLTGGFIDDKAAGELAKGKVKMVHRPTGTKKNGDPWLRYDVDLDDGETYKSFKDDLGARAEAAAANDRTVSIAYKIGKWGREMIDLVIDPLAEGASAAPATDANGQEPPEDNDAPPPPSDDDVPW